MSLKNHHGKSTFGMPSVILILSVLTLTIFSLLALRSSVNERKLALKTVSSVQDYYTLERNATYLLKDIANLEAGDSIDLCEKASKITGITNATSDQDRAYISYTCSLSPESTNGISVKLQIDLKTHELNILEWKTYHEDNSSYDFNLPD